MGVLEEHVCDLQVHVCDYHLHNQNVFILLLEWNHIDTLASVTMGFQREGGKERVRERENECACVRETVRENFKSPVSVKPALHADVTVHLLPLCHLGSRIKS